MTGIIARVQGNWTDSHFLPHEMMTCVRGIPIELTDEQERSGREVEDILNSDPRATVGDVVRLLARQPNRKVPGETAFSIPNVVHRL